MTSQDLLVTVALSLQDAAHASTEVNNVSSTVTSSSTLKGDTEFAENTKSDTSSFSTLGLVPTLPREISQAISTSNQQNEVSSITPAQGTSTHSETSSIILTAEETKTAISMTTIGAGTGSKETTVAPSIKGISEITTIQNTTETNKTSPVTSMNGNTTVTTKLALNASSTTLGLPPTLTTESSQVESTSKGQNETSSLSLAQGTTTSTYSVENTTNLTTEETKRASSMTTIGAGTDSKETTETPKGIAEITTIPDTRETIHISTVTTINGNTTFATNAALNASSTSTSTFGHNGTTSFSTTVDHQTEVSSTTAKQLPTIISPKPATVTTTRDFNITTTKQHNKSSVSQTAVTSEATPTSPPTTTPIQSTTTATHTHNSGNTYSTTAATHTITTERPYKGCYPDKCCVFDNTVVGSCFISNGMMFNNSEATGCWCDEACHFIYNDCCFDFVSFCLESNRTVITTPAPVCNENDNIPYGIAEGDSILKGDDEMTDLIFTGLTIAVGDGSESFRYVSVCSNGYLSLDKKSCTYNPQPIADIKRLSILAGFWTDLTDCDPSSVIYYRSVQRNIGIGIDTLNTASQVIAKYLPDYSFFEADWVFTATWSNYCMFSSPTSRISFQITLVSNGINTFAILQYINMSVVNEISDPSVSIGYKKGEFYKVNQYSYTSAVQNLHQLPGNTKCNGLWIYPLTSGATPTDETKCLGWFLSEKQSSSLESWMFFDPRMMCPCVQSLMQFEFFWRVFSNDGETICYATIRFWPMSAVCCYPANNFEGGLFASPPFAGTYVSYNPVWPSTKGLYHSNERERKRQCCDAGLCSLYYEVRPITECYIESPWVLGWFWGDPHIETLDGFTYTFNGWGEYTMLKVNNANMSFELQARTDLATTENMTTISATIFSAFVARDHTGSSLQVELSSTKSKMIVFGDGIDYTYQFYNDESFLVLGENLTISTENDTIVGSFLKSGIVIKVSVGTRLLILETIVSTELIGLLGNFDGDQSNDFILPDGTRLDTNDTNTERKIYENYGQKWAVIDTSSLFKYPKGKSHADYNHPEFVPLFIDEFPQAEQEAAKANCGGSLASQACVFDFLATGDKPLASESGDTDSKAEELKVVIANQPPVITGDRKIIAKVGESSRLSFSAYDDKGYRFQVLSSPSEGFIFDFDNGTALWTPSNTNATSISVTAVDNSSLEASPVDVEIVLCTLCNGNGYCDSNQTRETDKPLFSLGACVCYVGWSGDECEIDTDGCEELPCISGTTCTDLTPEEESRLKRGFNCSTCPQGFIESGYKCEDINECLNTTTHSCDQKCVNTDGSYTCKCWSGYRMVGSDCLDIDECAENTDGCQQSCENQDGGFLCSCFYGYSLQSDKKTCLQVLDICAIAGLTCEYGCTNTSGGYGCMCPSGYQLAPNGINCTNINECLQNSCDQICTDSVGSFNCSCLPGYKIGDDKTSCVACQVPYYGENCASICQCGQGSDQCDTVKGCVCNHGWTGADCDVDIDECSDQPNVCHADQICENHAGTYECLCRTGFYKNNSVCDDEDECASDSTHNCSEITSVCENNAGSFSCKCKAGYNQLTSYTCSDVNECLSGHHGCSQICQNVDGTYNCDCEFGFTLLDDRKTCKQVEDVCASFAGLNCSYGCTVDGETAQCFCPSGYRLNYHDNQTCENINECVDPFLNMCFDTSSCVDTPGNYNCSCRIGFYLENDRRTCKDIDECTESNPCEQRCINSDGSYRCDCQSGFVLYENTKCKDFDECSGPLSLCDQICANTIGSYKCSCHDGFILNSTTKSHCEEKTTCVEKHNNCSQRCAVKKDGTEYCLCNNGFLLQDDGYSCEDVDECESNPCEETCVQNEDGPGYTCSCSLGKQIDKDGRSCKVCTDFRYGKDCKLTCNCSVSHTLRCSNLNGTCECQNGWQGDTCDTDIDECEVVNLCPNNSYCINTPGSYRCDCNEGYIAAENKCLDIDECTTGKSTCSVDAHCFNTEGSYECVCKDGFEGNSTNCQRTTTTDRVTSEKLTSYSYSNITEETTTRTSNQSTMVSTTTTTDSSVENTKTTVTDVSHTPTKLQSTRETSTTVMNTMSTVSMENDTMATTSTDSPPSSTFIETTAEPPTDGPVQITTADSTSTSGVTFSTAKTDDNTNGTTQDTTSTSAASVDTAGSTTSMVSSTNPSTTQEVTNVADTTPTSRVDDATSAGTTYLTTEKGESSPTSPKMTPDTSRVSKEVTSVVTEASKITTTEAVPSTMSSTEISSSMTTTFTTPTSTSLPETSRTSDISHTSTMTMSTASLSTERTTKAPLRGTTEHTLKETFQLEYTLDVDVLKNISVVGSAEYESVKLSVHSSLFNFYNDTLKGFTTLVILSVRKGSLVVDHTVEVVGYDMEDSVANVMEAVDLLLNDAKTLVYESKEVKVTAAATVDRDTNQKVPVQSICSLYDARGLCKTNQKCVMKESRPFCLGNENQVDDERVLLTVGLVIASLMFVFLIVIIIATVKHYRERKKSKMDEDGLPYFPYDYNPTAIAGRLDTSSTRPFGHQKWSSSRHHEWYTYDDDMKGYVFYSGKK